MRIRKIKVITTVVLMVLLMMGAVYAEETIIDLTGLELEGGLQFTSVSPNELYIEDTHLSFVIGGKNLESIDLDSIYLLDTTVNETIGRVNYARMTMDHLVFDLQLTTDQQFENDHQYEFRFTKEYSNNVYRYRINPTTRGKVVIQSQLTNNMKQILEVSLVNLPSMSLLEDSFVLTDEHSKLIAYGSVEFMSGRFYLIFDTSKLVDPNAKYYVTTTVSDYSVNIDSDIGQYLKVTNEPYTFNMNDELFEYSRDHMNRYYIEYTGLNLDPNDMSRIRMQDSKCFSSSMLRDVKTNSKVDIKYTSNSNGTETLLLVIDKDYFEQSSYYPVFKVDGIEYESFNHFTTDNIEEYSTYYAGEITKNLITLTNKFSHHMMDFRGFGVGVEQSYGDLVELNLEYYKDVFDYYSVYRNDKIAAPDMKSTDTIIRTVSSPIINIKSRDYRNHAPLYITLKQNSIYIDLPGYYTFYQYDYLNENWKALETTTDKENARISADIETLGQFVLVNEYKTFPDIDSHWAKIYVENMYTKDKVSGANNQFRPDDTISRAEFVTMLINNLEFKKSEGEATFLDVSSSDWYYDFIEIAFENNLLIESENFYPAIEITRIDMATMIAKALGDIDIDLEAFELSFDDCNDLTDEQLNYVKINNSLGIINGRNDITFAPYDNATRAEAVVMISKLLQLLSK